MSQKAAKIKCFKSFRTASEDSLSYSAKVIRQYTINQLLKKNPDS